MWQASGSLPVGSLALPRVDDRPDVARATDAVSLFVSRARDVRPLAADDDDTIAAIAHVCRRLDGIPLAIELAARAHAIVVGGRDRSPSRRSLQAPHSGGAHGARAGTRRCAPRSIGASIFSARPNSTFSLAASVFAGGFTLDAAAAVCEPEPMSAIDTLDHVDGLVRRSMLIAEEDATTTRYRMLETIRQYAAERLEAIDDAVDTSRAHLEWCSRVRARSRRTAPKLRRRRLDSHGWSVSSTTSGCALQFAVSIGDLDAATDAVGVGTDRRALGQSARRVDGGARQRGRPDLGRTRPSRQRRAAVAARARRGTSIRRRRGGRVSPNGHASSPAATTTGSGPDPGWRGCSRA